MGTEALDTVMSFIANFILSMGPFDIICYLTFCKIIPGTEMLESRHKADTGL